MGVPGLEKMIPSVMVVGTGRSFDVHNRASAVCSMLCSALDLVADRFRISVNGEPFCPSTRPGSSPTAATAVRQSRPSSVAKALPERIKPLLREMLEERCRASLLARLLRADRPDVILELHRLGSSLGASLAQRHKAPLILYFDAPEVEQYEDIHGATPPMASRAREREERLLSQADRIVVYSEIVKDYLVRDRGLRAESILVFQTLDHTRMTPKQLAAPSAQPVIGYVGSFMEWHQLPTLVRAFAGLRNSGVDARLLLVGDGLARKQVEQVIEASGHRSSIEITGFLDGPMLDRQKSRIDLAVLPGTKWYNLPTKIFEYGAASIATVAPASPTAKSLFGDSKEVAFFREGDAADLQQLLRRGVEDRTWRLDLATSLARRVATQHTPEHTRRFYTSLLAETAAWGGNPKARQ
jgi:glycosyltransferase involved in cell wall biosynthesis